MAVVAIAIAGCVDPPPPVPIGDATTTTASASSEGGTFGDATGPGTPADSSESSEASESSGSIGSTGAPEDTSTTGAPGCAHGEVLAAGPDGPYFVDNDALLAAGADQGILANDQAPGSCGVAIASYEKISDEWGLVTIDDDGSFVYQIVDPDFPFGADRFSYTIESDDGQSASADVRVVVRPPDSTLSVADLGRKGVRLQGIDPGDYAGYSVSGAGDVDGDGFSDLLVGAYNADPNGSSSGETYLVYGGPQLPSTMSLSDADVRFEGVYTSDASGYTVSGVGDVNGDGHADLLIGAYQSDIVSSNEGSTYLVYGSDALPSEFYLGAADVRFRGIDSSDYSGYSVAGAGDVNGDGFDDLLIGAPYADLVSTDSAGEAYLVLGGSALPSTIDLDESAYVTRLTGNISSGRAGNTVSPSGDVNGDGYADFLVSAPHSNNQEGDVYLVYGSASFPSSQALVSSGVRFTGSYYNSYTGEALGGTGDVNGDGYDDILIGAYGASSYDGETYLIYGGPALPSSMSPASADVRFSGATPNEHAGRAVSIAGDVDADGYADIFIGADYADPPGTGNGGVGYLVLGGPDLPPEVNLSDVDLRLEGLASSDYLGQSLSGVDDIDGDGFGDLLIGAYRANPVISDEGEAYLVFGDDLLGSTTHPGTDTGDTIDASNGGGRDALNGGRGDDVLRSDGGPDVLHGGSGDDTLVVVDGDFFRVDGGLGFDTLEVEAEAGVLLAPALSAPRIREIEAIQLSLRGDVSISLPTPRYIANLSSTTNTLIIEGDAGDVVDLSGSWSGPANEGFYVSYSAGEIIVRIDADITVLF